MEYSNVNLNEDIYENESDHMVFPLDLSMARIRSDNESDLGINHIDVSPILEEDTVELERNGWSSDESSLVTSYYNHDNYTQSTPTARGQFKNSFLQATLSNHASLRLSLARQA